MNTIEEPTNSFHIILFTCRTWRVMKVKIRLGSKFPHGKGRCLMVITYAPCEQGSWNWRGPSHHPLRLQHAKPPTNHHQNHQFWRNRTSHFVKVSVVTWKCPTLIFCIENPWILQLPGRRKAAWTPVLRVVTSLGIIWRGERWVKDESNTVWYILHKHSWFMNLLRSF